MKRASWKEQIAFLTTKFSNEWISLKNFFFVFLWLFLLLLLEFSSLYFSKANMTFGNPFLQALPIFLALAAPVLFLGKWGCRIYLTVLFPYLTLLQIVAMFLAYGFNMQLDADAFFVMGATSKQEIMEFFHVFVSLKYIILLIATPVLLVGGVWFFWKRDWKKPTLATAVLGCLALLPVTITATRYAVKREASRSLTRTVCTRFIFDFFQFNENYNRLLEMARHPEVPEGLTLTSKQAEKILGVIVIGESANRNRLGMYGYCRNTDPEMKKLRNETVVFRDAISCWGGTTQALYPLLTQAERENPEGNPKCSIVDVYKKAGFRVSLYSSQFRWGFSDGPIAVMFSGVDKRVYIQEERRNNFHDDELLTRFRREIAENPEGPSIVFLHLLGSHNDPASRYPKTWKPFTNVRDAVTRNLDEDIAECVNAYDNSIAFTDKLLGEIAAELKKTGRPAFLLYFSDHGERQQETDTPGRFTATTNRDVYEIPLLLWTSESYRKTFPAFAAQMAKNTEAPIQTDQLFWGMTALAQITAPDFPDSKNIFSEKFSPQTVRYIGHHVLYQKRK